MTIYENMLVFFIRIQPSIFRGLIQKTVPPFRVLVIAALNFSKCTRKTNRKKENSPHILQTYMEFVVAWLFTLYCYGPAELGTLCPSVELL